MIFYDMKRYNDSEKYFRKAIKLNPKNIIKFEYLVYVLENQGKIYEAEKYKKNS